MKKYLNRFIAFTLVALGACAALAENATTFTLVKSSRYYVDNREVWGEASFIEGTFGTFTSFESFPSSATYSCSPDSGYHAAKWVLRTAGISGNKTIRTWTSASSITIEFDYKTFKNYNGQALELLVYVEQMSYTVSYDPNGGTWTAGAPEGGTYAYTEGETAPSADAVTYDERTLTGWKATSGALIDPDESFTGEKLGITKDGQSVVLYAQWKAEYTVTLAVPKESKISDTKSKYTKDETESAEDEDWDYYTTTYVYGTGLTLPKVTTTKAGSTFEGWYDNANFVHDPDSKLYSKVTKISKTDSGDKEYWAKFETKLAIHYDGNGSSKGTMSDQEFVSGEAISLTRNAFEKVYTVKFKLNGATGTTPANQTADYTFSHWNTEKDGTGNDSYEDGQSVTFDATEGFTLYAQWEEEQDAITLPTPDVWSGHSFSGWWTQQSGGTCVGYGESKYAPQGNITLYAHWDGQGDLSAAVGLTNATLTTWCTKTISYQGPDNVWSNYVENTGNTCLSLSEILFSAKKNNIGLTSVLAMNVTGPGKVVFKAKGLQTIRFFDGHAYDSEEIEPSTSWARVFTNEVGAGLVQLRWEVCSTNKKVYLDDIRWIPDTPEGKVTITAEPSDYAGGSVTGGGTYDKDTTVTLKAKPKTNWKFIEWRSGGQVVSRANSFQTNAVADATYTAILADEWYYIAYNANGGTGKMDKQLAVRDDKTTTLTANAFTKSGYTFKAWNTKKDGSGDSYADGASVTNLALSGKTVTLYAVWKSGEEEDDPGEEEEEEEEECTPEPGPYASAIGEAVSVDLAADCGSKTIKKVSGLPTGLKYATKTGLVTGTPTKAVSKENNVTITFTDATTVKCTWTVEALPTMLVGTYWGTATLDGSAGIAQVKLLKTGKATGSFYAAGKKVSLKSTALAALGDGYVLTMGYTYNRVKYTEELLLTCAATVDGVDVWSVSLGDTSEALDDFGGRRDTIKENFGKVVAKTTTYAIEDADFADGEYLKAKVTTAGAVTVSGKLFNAAGKLTAVSCTTHLVVGDDGVPYCDIAIYKAVSKQDPIVYTLRWSLPES